ncbi:hypothetical protein J4447_00110 [Candidatus Pacearchaeota archaeon]|nr:hypothetical protein [Candidatus Pacearchaeota archaeon]
MIIINKGSGNCNNLMMVRMIKGNRRGGENIMIFWQFLMWLLVGLGIVIGVVSFYASQIEVKAIEAEILSERIAGCLIDSKGVFNLKYFSDSGKYELLNDCGLSRGILDESGYFYIIANLTLVSDINSVGNTENWKPLKSFSIGNKDLLFQCDVKRKGMEAQKFGDCTQRSLYGFYGGEDSKGNNVKGGSEEGREGAIVQLFVGSNNRGA